MVRTQEIYFLKKKHKNPLSARPIVSGCDGTTEKISAYLDHWLQRSHSPPTWKIQRNLLITYNPLNYLRTAFFVPWMFPFCTPTIQRKMAFTLRFKQLKNGRTRKLHVLQLVGSKSFQNSFCTKMLSDSTINFTSKNRAQPWVQRWHLPMPTFSWGHLNPEFSLKQNGILDIKTHIKPTNTEQYVHASSAHPSWNGPGYHQRRTT